VAWRGIEGFANSSYLAGGEPVYAYEPAPVYVAPPPVVSFGFGWGPRWGSHWRGRDHGHSSHSHHGRHH